MSSIQGRLITYAVVSAKQAKVRALHGLLKESRISKSGLWGSKVIYCGRFDVGNHRQLHDVKVGRCNYSSSSDGNGSTAENFDHNDADYVDCSLIEDAEVMSSPNGFILRFSDGHHLRCVQNNPQAEQLPDFDFCPAIVLKIEDGTNLLLPIIVLDMPGLLPMKAINHVYIVRPTMYEVMLDMIDQMGYAVKLVRITEKVREAYCAQMYLTKLGNKTRSLTLDIRLTDAINIAVICDAPIQVHKNLASNDGMKAVESAMLFPGFYTVGLQLTELDRPTSEPCSATKEFDLLLNMWNAAIEERYEDAGIVSYWNTYVTCVAQGLFVECVGDKILTYTLRCYLSSSTQRAL